MAANAAYKAALALDAAYAPALLSLGESQLPPFCVCMVALRRTMLEDCRAGSSCRLEDFCRAD